MPALQPREPGGVEEHRRPVGTGGRDARAGASHRAGPLFVDAEPLRRQQGGEAARQPQRRQSVTPHTGVSGRRRRTWWKRPVQGDRKSTRLNSSHGYISYAVFCLKKKKKKKSKQR